MASVQQVFNTNELLEIIICQVDQYQIRELKLVARSWRDTISRSKAVRRARIVSCGLAPDAFEDIDTNTLSAEDLSQTIAQCLVEFMVVPLYDTDDWIRINPALKQVHACPGQPSGPWQGYVIRIMLPEAHNAATFATSASEYVTDPPCNSIEISTQHWDNELGDWYSPFWPTVCWAYNKNGLTIGDLLTGKDEVVATHMRVAEQNDDPLSSRVIAYIKLVEVNGPEFSEADKTMGARYFQGPLPRYKKATHQTGPEIEATEAKDKALVWNPADDGADTEGGS